LIPSNIQFLDDSAFIGVTLLSISIESGNDIFALENGLLIDIFDHKLVQNFCESSTIDIGRNIEIVGSNFFAFCKSLSSIAFESNSH
jgi:hypothetical protein